MRSTKRQLSPKLKFQIVVEALAGTRTPGQIAKLYGVHPNSVGLWRKIFLERGRRSLPALRPSASMSGGSRSWNSCWARKKSRSRF